jgi:hypothetical protein
VIERAKQFLFGRRSAYRQVFDLSGARTEVVLADLAKFCRAHASTAHVDPTMAARLDGRREVWLRISHHLHLTDEQLWQLYGGGQ